MNEPMLVSGQVTDTKGKPVPLARVYLSSGPTAYTDTAMLSDAKGRFTFAVHTEGSYVLECATDGFLNQQVKFEAKAGKTVSLAITLKPVAKRRK